MPGGLAEWSVVATLHQGEPARRVVADCGDLLLSPRCGRNPGFHTNRIPRGYWTPARKGVLPRRSHPPASGTGGESDNPTTDDHPGPAEAAGVIFDPERTSYRAAGAIRPSEMCS